MEKDLYITSHLKTHKGASFGLQVDLRRCSALKVWMPSVGDKAFFSRDCANVGFWVEEFPIAI